MLSVSHKIKVTVTAECFPVDRGVAEHNCLRQCPTVSPHRSSVQSCRDSKASYYKIIVYSYLSTVVTFAAQVSRFHN